MGLTHSVPPPPPLFSYFTSPSHREHTLRRRAKAADLAAAAQRWQQGLLREGLALCLAVGLEQSAAGAAASAALSAAHVAAGLRRVAPFARKWLAIVRARQTPLPPPAPLALPPPLAPQQRQPDVPHVAAAALQPKWVKR